MRSKDLLLIFTRNPELGKCKTRLAATIGDRAALEIYKFLLGHTAQITSELKVDKAVFYSNSIATDNVWNPEKYLKKLQQGNTLGERMKHACEWALRQKYQKTIIIGSDIYDLSPEDLEMAFEALDKHDFVVGPASDGGYYLLGMTKFKEDVFLNKTWGTETVLQDTLQDLKGESVYLLPVRNDVDVYEDIRDNEVFKKFLKQTYDK
ncbi:MAG: TIGR04282 family arsenosugar biosynthesis glycosyltransferase [Eudoraea sp.]|nr:TIGR04282 family arsenosugar biosynthesis glycosyltransferase [Eudoraea sp.]NNK30977.1 glycosyltransferase [Flavobacteriaceae bacterium]